MLLQLLLLLWCGFRLVVYGVLQGQDLQGEISQQQQINAGLAQRNDRLASQVKGLRSDDLLLIEERARRDLGMVKDNETFFIFVD